MATNRLAGCAQLLAAIGNHDFCPWANRYLYWLKQPIGWLVVGAGAALLTAVFLEPRAWIILGSLVAVILLGIAWPGVAMRAARAEIAFDCRRCREGEHVQVRLIVHNRWPWPLWGLAVENGFFPPADGPDTRPVAALARVAGWSRSEFVFEFRPEQRGVYPHDVPRLASGFPFGIWKSSRAIPVQHELLVWPRTTPLTSIPRLRGDIADVIGMLFDRPGNDGDLNGVRPFRRGDRLRSIHWAQTARRDSLIVNERQAAARRLVVVAVDLAAFLNVGSTYGGPRHRQLEMAIRVAASIATEFHARHADVRFVGGSVDLLLSPGVVGPRRLLDALARLEVGQPSARPPSPFDRGALSVIVTSSQRRSEWEQGAGTSGPLRLVLIDRHGDLPLAEAAGIGGNHASPRSRNVWIKLDGDSNDASQLRHQWERIRHERQDK